MSHSIGEERGPERPELGEPPHLFFEQRALHDMEILLIQLLDLPYIFTLHFSARFTHPAIIAFRGWKKHLVDHHIMNIDLVPGQFHDQPLRLKKR